MKFLRHILLVPLSWLYGLGVGLRHMLYDMHILHSRKVNVHTICVGNLAVGGTGKTPHIEWLIRELSPQYKVAVLSRGYRRRSHGFVMADASSTANELGDECMQLHCKFPDVPIAVCKNRKEGIDQLQKLCPDLDVVLLDDAYQYRRLQCGFYILLTTADRLYTEDRLLPAGRLRDFAWQSHKANAVIVTKCPDTMTAIDRRVVSHSLQLPAYQNLFFSYICYDELPEFKRALLVTGIARPEYLRQYIESKTDRQKSSFIHLSYPDHHSFSKADIRRMTEEAQKVDIVLTTEKDFARLQAMELPENLKIKLKPIAITVKLSDENLLLEQIKHYLQLCI
ncbi:MAG: tetraacyldisaccharide 4'-kinase [Paludibacteraceae bacterium]|nr:tetraacyldisaccharide 4'-kinase [Paludibacteraceae bacterium]